MKKLLPLVFIYFQLLMAGAVFGQKEANMWYFGNNAGVDFNSGSPIAFSGSAMTQLEGCASISDTAGNTLFYTNGALVWNRLNTQMPNGLDYSGIIILHRLLSLSLLRKQYDILYFHNANLGSW